MSISFSILSSVSTATTVVVAIICMTVLFLLLYLSFLGIGKYLFRRAAMKLKPEAVAAQEELGKIFLPTSLVTDSKIAEFKEAHTSLLSGLEKLEKHSFYTEKVFKLSGLESFREIINRIPEMKEENKRVYQAIQDLKESAPQILADYNQLQQPWHYFAHSEMEHFLSSHSDLKKNLDVIVPQYNQFVTDENSRQLIQAFQHIEANRSEHNKQFVASELLINDQYFNHVLGNYPLDPQQRDSIVKLEDNCLVIASAGSGKTSTIVGKAKYLVEKRNIAPENILILTFTRKAANTLAERIGIENIHIGTFHSLAYHVIAQATGQAPTVCGNDLPLNVFHKLIKEDEHFLHGVTNYIVNLQSLMKLEHEYFDAFTYFDDRKKYGIQALFPDVDGRIIFTRSEEEKRLCSILTGLGIMFRYEYAYPINTQTPEHRQYKPDFTIYYKDKEGQWQRVFLEHFAIDNNGLTPRWFGTGTKGGWKMAHQMYVEGIKWKRATHKKYHTVLIETTSADFHDGTVVNKLVHQLTRCGVPVKSVSDKELYDKLVQRNRKLENTIFTLLLSFVTLLKANEKTIEGLLESLNEKDTDFTNSNDARNKRVLMEVMKPFVEAYQAELVRNYEVDFTDIILQATNLCRKGLWKQYDYILVDEFQDLSVDRYKFLQALRSDRPRTKLFCVGDDWQSIFRFAGSDMALFYDFEKYFGQTELCKIETTYRFHNPLMDTSSDFVMKNPSQKKKNIRSFGNNYGSTQLLFVKCASDDKGMLMKATEIIDAVPMCETILILGRYNYDVLSVGYEGKVTNRDQFMNVRIAGREVPFMSVHSAKGLEADHIILVNCNRGAYGFPSLIEDDPILDFVLSRSEQYPFAEERRLFYVAMTRAKKSMHVLYDERRPSPFVSEFFVNVEKGSYLCPQCLEGKIIAVKDGVSSNGKRYRSFSCSNHEAGCDFFETRFGDLTPPGFLVKEGMTARDIENIRENRRRAGKLRDGT